MIILLGRLIRRVFLILFLWLIPGFSFFAFAVDCGSTKPVDDCTDNEKIIARALFAAVKLNDVKTVTSLAGGGADLTVTDEAGWSVLMWAAFNGRSRIAKPLLVHGADPNFTTQDGVTPLHIAAARGHGVVARLLIAFGGDPNATDKKGLSPLQAATLQGHKKTTRVLVQGGAHVNATYGDGTSVFAKTPVKAVGPDLSKVTLSDAVLAGNLAVARAKIKQVKDVNAIEVGQFNPLMYAALTGNAAMVRFLFKHGADANVIHGNYTPLIAAVHGRNATVLKLIYSRTNPFIRSWRPAKFAATPLDIARAYARHENRRDLLAVFKHR